MSPASRRGSAVRCTSTATGRSPDARKGGVDLSRQIADVDGPEVGLSGIFAQRACTPDSAEVHSVSELQRASPPHVLIDAAPNLGQGGDRLVGFHRLPRLSTEALTKRRYPEQHGEHA